MSADLPFEDVELHDRRNSRASSADYGSPQILPVNLSDGHQDISELPLRARSDSALFHLGASPETAADSGGRRRRVQWQIGEDDPHLMHGHREQDALLQNRRPASHTAVHMLVPWSFAFVNDRIARSDQDDRRSQGDYFSRASSASDTPEWSNLNTPEQSRPPSPGDDDVDIGEGERDGLPQKHNAARKFNRQAAKLIGAHRAKTAFMAGRKARNEGVDPDQLREALAKSAFHQDQNSNGLTHTKPVAGTSGVLSSILRLYDNQEETSANSSQATLVSSTHQEDRSSRTNSRPTTPFLEFAGAFRRTADEVGSALRKTTDKVSNTLSERDRPAQARSNGGVFGALQAGALDLAGVASPTATTVRPNAERSGHRVNRYQLDGASKTTTDPSPTGSTSTTPPSGSSLAGRTGTEGSKNLRPNSRNRSALSLSGLTDVFDPHRYQSESHVVRHYKQSTSGQNTPMNEVPSYEKAMTDKPSGLNKRRKKEKRKHEEIFITMHVAAILQRQDFILRLARALMMFGAPSHRFEAQLQRTAKVLDIECQVIYLMGFMIVAFQDADTHTSEIKIVKQNAGLNLHKLKSLAILHWEVMHDKIGVQDASTEISRLMTCKPVWNKYWSILLGGFCSSFIGAASFNASFVDALISFPLGCAVIAIQVFVASKSEILSNCFEIFVTAVASFIAAALQSSGQFCYAAVISSTIVLILPGWLVCCAALELQSRSIVTGSVRLIWAIIYSLFLGFGISIGSTIWNGVAPNRLMLPDDITCSAAHSIGVGLTPPWWKQTVPKWWAFLLVPGYASCLSLKNQAKIKTREYPAMVLLACIGWTVNYFSGRAFAGRTDISSALGALAVSFCANLWGKFGQGTSFIVALPGILFQLPSGLGSNGLLAFANSSANSNSIATFSSGLQVAQQLLTVSIGLVVGIIGGSILVQPFGSKRVKDIMSF